MPPAGDQAEEERQQALVAVRLVVALNLDSASARPVCPASKYI